MTKPQPASMLASELRMMKSKATGQKYRISIALPYAYADKSLKSIPFFDKALTAWPVIYLLDADWMFGMVTDTVRLMAWMGRTTDAIVVGIGYPEERSIGQTWRQCTSGRTRDLTPVSSAVSDTHWREMLKLDVTSGGGPAFHEFIKQELIPLIDKKYRTDPAKRILAGHSHGGLFTVFAMFQEPRLFSHYIASSPSINFANDNLFDRESAYAKKHKGLPAHLHLSEGDLEIDEKHPDYSDTDHFATILENRKYKGFSLTKQVFPDSNHVEVIAPALHEGLKKALKK